MHKLGAALAVAVVLVLLASAYAVFEVRRAALELTLLLQRDVASLSNTQELAVGLEEAARSARMVLISGDPKFEQQLAELRVRTGVQLAALQASASNARQRELLKQASQLRGAVMPEMDRATAMARAGDARAASMHVLAQVEPLRERLADRVQAVVQDKKAELARLTSQHTQASDRAVSVSGLFGGLSLFAGALLALLLREAVRRRRETARRLGNIFQGAAVAIMEVDCSKLARALVALREQGERDLEQYVEQRPERARELIGLIEICEVNPALNALLEIGPDARLRSLEQVVAVDTLPVLRKALVALWNGERRFRSEALVKTLAGNVIDAHLTISFPEDLAREAVVVTFTDVSARKHEERRSRELLERSEARLRAVFDQCPLGISMSDVSGRLNYLNPTAQRILKQTSSSDAARSLDLVMAQDRQRVAEWRQDFLSGRTHVSELTFSIQTLLGETRTLRTQASLLREDGQVRGIVSTIEDVTDRLRLEEQLRQAQKMDAVGQLAGGVAHDFNNLLTIILNGASLLQANASPEQAELLGQVEAAAERAASLTAQLLAFGRKQVLRRRVVDLNELVTNHVRLLRRLVGEKVQLETRLDPAGAPAEVDPNLMELLLMNLVVNARDALPLGGTILIRLESVVSDDEHSRALLDLSVTDNGSGIASEHLPHVFEPFFTTKSVGQGTGLGLATVYSIVEQHKGRIEVSSMAGQGTCFHVYLPRAEAALTTLSSAPPPPATGHETLLLVEDEAPVRTMVAASLARCGYEVIEAENGDAALALWRKHASRVALLLTDMVMPGSMSGRDLARRLRAERPELKVVYMSGYGAQEVAEEPWSVLVQKPFQLSTLAQALRARLDQPQPAMLPKPGLPTTPARGVGVI